MPEHADEGQATEPIVVRATIHVGDLAPGDHVRVDPADTEIAMYIRKQYLVPVVSP